jgi:hypothetical protein
MNAASSSQHHSMTTPTATTPAPTKAANPIDRSDRKSTNSMIRSTAAAFLGCKGASVPFASVCVLGGVPNRRNDLERAKASNTHDDDESR